MKQIRILTMLVGIAAIASCEAQTDPTVVSAVETKTGGVRLPLVTVSNGRTFRLENAEFNFVGPQTQIVRSSSYVNELEVQLPIGNYQVELRPGWQLLEVLSGGVERAVTAIVSGPNPLPLTITTAGTSDALFQLQLVGTSSTGVGRIRFGVDTGACVPTSCAALGAVCGTTSDGCGSTLSCGNCVSPATCNASNQCSCTPKTCASVGAQCGTVSDGCGGTLNCGNCVSPATCNASNQCSCTPKTCATLGAQCGTVSDGCGGTLNCGNCVSPATCNTSNQCATTCAPKTCATLGAQCGTVLDGCGGTLSCGNCTSPATCNASNQCATTCAPKTCATLGAQCGTVSDGCGGTLSCGNCTSPATCNASNQCTTSLTATLKVNGQDWSTGFCRDVIVANGANSATKSWYVVISMKGSTLASAWNTVSSTVALGSRFDSTSSNAIIAAKTGTQAFGFCANKPATGAFVEPVVVSVTPTF